MPAALRSADLGDGTFRNPILPGDRPDPAIVRVGDDFYLTHSSFDSVPGLTIWHSRDLVNWTPIANALPEPAGTVFAPDFVHHDGRFFLYIPLIPAAWSELTAPEIVVVTADDPAGPWSEPVSTGIRGAIDPGHGVDDEGRRWLFTNGIRRAPLDDEGLRATGPLEHVYDGWRYPDDWVTEAYALEGPKLFRRDGWHYLVSAVGGTSGPATGHMVIVARSRSLHGPWENSPHNPVTRTRDASEAWWSRGHATILDAPDGSWWMVSHGYEKDYRTLGRQMLLEPISWTDDGWPVAPATDLGAPIAKPRADASALPVDPPIDWRMEDGGPSARTRVRRDGDGFVLAAAGSSPADSAPLATLAGEHRYRVEVTLTADPGATGALLLYVNPRLFCGMAWDGERMTSYAGGITTHWREPVPFTGPIRLRLENAGHIVTGWYAGADGEWHRHGVRYDTSGYHAATVQDLKSLRPALGAFGDGEVRFTDLRYTALEEDAR
ncbi:family 43 glycosylhydrolase [Microbacterium sp. GXF7504]